MFLQNIRMALASIQRNKLRSALTMLGIIIGIGSVITVIAIGDGLKAQVNDEVNSLGTDTITIAPKPDGSALTLEDLNKLNDLESIQNTAPITQVATSVSSGATKFEQASVNATSPQLSATLNRNLDQGRFFGDQESNQIVIGAGVASSLFGTDSPIDKIITLSQKDLSADAGPNSEIRHDFRVIGVYPRIGSATSLGPGAQLDNSLYISLEDGKFFSGGQLFIDQFVTQAKDPNQIAAAKQQITETLKANHQGSEDFVIQTSEDVSASFNDILNVVTNFITAIAAISLLVGGIGIMNIMLTSVTERTREIGIRKSIGASQRTILSQFMVEALVLTFAGGLLGIMLAVFASTFLKTWTDIQPVFSVKAFLIGCGISLFIGVVFGSLPAYKAAQKKPIDALRHE